MKFFLPFRELAGIPLLASDEEYREYRKDSMAFVAAHNARIASRVASG